MSQLVCNILIAIVKILYHKTNDIARKEIFMNILDIIENKRDKKELSKEEIEYFVKGYTDGTVSDYQAAALIMAIYINGMNERETTDLTLAMAYSGDILDLSDVREVSDIGFVIDSTDVLTTRNEVVKLDEVMSLEFDLIGLKVVDQKGKKMGKIVDYTVDSGSFMVYQLIVQRPLMSSFLDPQLTINRSQIVEIDDFKVVIKHSTSKVKIPKKKEADEEFVPNFVNPFRKPDYAPSDEKVDSSSDTSE